MVTRDAEAFVIETGTAEVWRREALAAVAGLKLPDGWIGAGFLRAPVWDRLHGYTRPTPLDDIDVVYFDPERAGNPTEDRLLEAELGRRLNLPWQVRNQARMHEGNGDAPYRSTADALGHWLETPTAVAIRQTPRGGYTLLAPFGLDDLLAMILRPTPYARARRMAAYRRRIESKPWRAHWPKLRLVTA